MLNVSAINNQFTNDAIVLHQICDKIPQSQIKLKEYCLQEAAEEKISSMDCLVSVYKSNKEILDLILNIYTHRKALCEILEKELNL